MLASASASAHALGPLPLGPSDLLVAPADADADAALTARELARVLRNAGNALARARHGPAAARPPRSASALSLQPSAPPEAVEAERQRVQLARDEFPDAGWESRAPSARMPLAARASPSGTWDHQEAARNRPRPASASASKGRAALLPSAVGGQLLRPNDRPATALAAAARAPRAAAAAARPDDSDLSGPDAWWERLNSARGGRTLLSDSEAAHARARGLAPPAPPLESRHDIPTAGCWIRLSEQHAAPIRAQAGQPPQPRGVGLGAGLGFKEAQPAPRACAARTFGTAARASASGTWAHQAAVPNNADRRAPGEKATGALRGPVAHKYGSFLPLRPGDVNS
jgi:hypothetical protein